MRRMTGASLNGRRPAQISTSAWRGEKAWRSMPKRAKSKRLAAVAMNSMAQHAVPNGIGHSELARDQFTALSAPVTLRAQVTSSSKRVVSQFGLPDTSLVSITRFTSLPLLDAFPRRHALDALIPLQRAPLPHVHVPHPQDQHEHQHLDQQEPRSRPARPAR